VTAAISRKLIVSASDAQRTVARCSPNRSGLACTFGEHIHPARLASANGSSSTHNALLPLREVRPPHE